MDTVRVRLRRLAATFLACQLAAFIAAPVSLAGHGAPASEECECPGGMASQACPMHRSPIREADPGGSCVLRSAASPSDAALVSLGIGLGILVSTLSPQTETRIEPVHGISIRLVDRVVLPDSPPPRA